MKVLKGIDNWLGKILTVLVALFTAAIMIVVNVQVFARYIFNFSLGGLSDAPPYLMIFVIWMGAVLAARNRDHISIEVLDLVVKNEIARKIVKAVVMLVTTLAFGYFTYYAYLYTRDAFALGAVDPSLKINYGWLYGIMPVTGVLITVYFLVAFISMVREVVDKCRHC